MPCKEAGENQGAGVISLRLKPWRYKMSTSIEASFHALIVLTVAFMAGFPSIGLGGAFVMWIVYKVAADWLDDWCWRTRWLP